MATKPDLSYPGKYQDHLVKYSYSHEIILESLLCL